MASSDLRKRGRKAPQANGTVSKKTLKKQQQQALKDDESSRRRTILIMATGVFLAWIGIGFYFWRRQGFASPKRGRAQVKESTLPGVPNLRPRWELIETLPHDEDLFTQGLFLHQGQLYESTGMHGSSEIRRMDPNTFEVYHRVPLDDHYFGEGIAFVPNTKDSPKDDNGDFLYKGGKIIQLTWREQTAFLYSADTLVLEQNFTYETTTNEGWGITYNPDAHELIVSDGSPNLHFWDADTLQEKRRLEVTLQLPDQEDGTEGELRQVVSMNELEWHNKTILSNIWMDDVIIRIDPKSGRVLTVYDFGRLYPRSQRTPKADVLNGISLTDVENELWVTGKYWPHMYRVRLLD